jgi:hypothetical protein
MSHVSDNGVTSVLDASERLERLDREAEELKDGFVEVISQLQHLSDDDTSFEERWQTIAQRLRQLRYDLLPQDFDKEQVVDLSAALLDIYELINECDRFDTLDQVLIRFERIRHVVRDALDEHVNGVTGNMSQVLEEMLGRLPNVPRNEVATLLGVDRRTLARWSEQTRPPARRLDVVARLVAILRHNWTEDGIVAWFHRPRRDLGGRTPLDVLSEPHFDESVLIASARAGRSQYAS